MLSLCLMLLVASSCLQVCIDAFNYPLQLHNRLGKHAVFVSASEPSTDSDAKPKKPRAKKATTSIEPKIKTSGSSLFSALVQKASSTSSMMDLFMSQENNKQNDKEAAVVVQEETKEEPNPKSSATKKSTKKESDNSAKKRQKQDLSELIKAFSTIVEKEKKTKPSESLDDEEEEDDDDLFDDDEDDDEDDEEHGEEGKEWKVAEAVKEERDPEASKLRSSLSPEALRALKAQGISVSELLKQQAEIVSQGDKKAYPSVKRVVEKKKAPVAKKAPEEEDEDDDDDDDIEYDLLVKEIKQTMKSVTPKKTPIEPKKELKKEVSKEAVQKTVSQAGSSSVEKKLLNLISNRKKVAVSATPDVAANTANGVTLKAMLEYLVEAVGYPKLFEATNLRCFEHKPSVNSSLKVLRQTDMEWAREKIQSLYLKHKK